VTPCRPESGPYCPDSATYPLTQSLSQSLSQSLTRSPTPCFHCHPLPSFSFLSYTFPCVYIEVLEPHFNRQSPHSIPMTGARISGRHALTSTVHITTTVCPLETTVIDAEGKPVHTTITVTLAIVVTEAVKALCSTCTGPNYPQHTGKAPWSDVVTGVAPHGYSKGAIPASWTQVDGHTSPVSYDGYEYGHTGSPAASWSSNPGYPTAGAQSGPSPSAGAQPWSSPSAGAQPWSSPSAGAQPWSSSSAGTEACRLLLYKNTKLRRRRSLLETGKIQRGRQGASSKRANGDFPSRGWKILIGWQESGSTEYGRWRCPSTVTSPPPPKKACP